jgi:hypothetical protein
LANPAYWEQAGVVLTVAVLTASEPELVPVLVPAMAETATAAIMEVPEGSQRQSIM